MTGLSALAVAAVVGACGNSTTQEAPASSATASVSAEEAPHNQADMSFAHTMIPHHQQAIEMSDLILAKQGIDPRVVQLATQIKAAQGPEIEQMQGWMVQWGAAGMPGMDHGGMHGDSAAPGMDGMMSAADMDALKNASGVEAAKLFLTGMIKHHQGALTMAQDEITNGQFPAAVAMAKSILTSQQKEIDSMNQILNSL